MERLAFCIEQENAGNRLDLFLSDELDNLSRSRIKKLIEIGEITVNHATAKVGYKLKHKDTVFVCIKEAEPYEILPEEIPLAVLYEDEDVIVINKPKGMVVHPAAGHTSGTLVNALMYHCRGSLSGINGLMRPGIVHRIDKDTSGVIVAAKNDMAHISLSKQLSEHSVVRLYKGICYGKPKDDELLIDANIGRSKADRKKMAVVKTGGKSAVTTIKLIERYKKHALFEARLKTGRTHQIRVHMSHIGYPLLGDNVYGSQKQTLFSEGQLLHAELLGFIHPSTNSYLEFCAQLPEYFIETLEKIKAI